MKKKTTKYLSEDGVKNILNVDSFSNLSEEKMKQLASMIPYVDKEVVKTILNQFPSIVGFAEIAISEYKQMFDNILEKTHESHMEKIRSYKLMLETLAETINTESITEDLKKYIIEKMLFITERIAEEDLMYRKDSKESQQNLWNNIKHVLLYVLCPVLLIVFCSNQKKRH